MRILGNGIIEYAGKRNGQTWRTTIAPGDTERASELLNADELAQVQAAWTPAVLDAWAAQQAAIEAEMPVDPDPPPPTPQEEIAELKAALIELADEGAISPARLARLRAGRAGSPLGAAPAPL